MRTSHNFMQYFDPDEKVIVTYSTKMTVVINQLVRFLVFYLKILSTLSLSIEDGG